MPLVPLSGAGLLALAAAGCAAPPLAEEIVEVRVDDGTDPGEIGSEPTLTGEDVAAAVAHVFEVGLPDPWQIHDTYLDLLSAGDLGPAECPGSLTQLTGEGVPRSGCVSSTGYSYLGVSTYQYTDQTDEAGIQSLDFFIDGDFEIVMPAGNAFEVGGHTGYFRLGTPTQWQGGNTVAGTWRLVGAAGALGAGISADLTVQGGVLEARSEVLLDGAAAAGSDSVQFEGVVMDVTNCAGRPIGTIRVREPSGYWYTIELSEDCSGCGEATFFDGTSLGEVCVPLEGVAEDILTDLGHWL